MRREIPMLVVLCFAVMMPLASAQYLAVLGRDYLTCPEEEIRNIPVLLTMVGGQTVLSVTSARPGRAQRKST